MSFERPPETMDAKLERMKCAYESSIRVEKNPERDRLEALKTVFSRTSLGSIMYHAERLEGLIFSHVESEENRRQRAYHYQSLGELLGPVILLNNTAFLNALVRILKCRKDGKPFTSKILNLPSDKRGRKKAPYDLHYTFTAGVLECYRRRTSEYGGADFTTQLIGRKELRLAIQSAQIKAGLKNAPLISESELSRWLNGNGIGDDMAEKPIARKRTRKT